MQVDEGDFEDFNEIFSTLHISLQQKVQAMLTNYQVDRERFSDIYRMYEHNIQKENHINNSVPLEQEIIQQIESKLLNEGQPANQKPNKNGGARKTEPVKKNSALISKTAAMKFDIFSSLAYEKKQKIDRKKQKMNDQQDATKNMSKQRHSVGGQHNSAPIAAPTYSQRKNRGTERAIYNNGVIKTPGTYNPSGNFQIESLLNYESYDFLNLTPANRTAVLQSQFEVVENLLRTQLKTEQFEDFYSPIQTCQRVCGRVVNISTDDPKLKEINIGLFNAAHEQQCRLRLNLAELQQYSLFEGEVIVAEGFMDTKKFNVNRIWKPAVQEVNAPVFSKEKLQEYKKMQDGKAMSIMVACGPYTVNNELSYEGLKDLVQTVNREKPHALILGGPFVSQQHEDILSGDLKCHDPQTGEEKFLDYQQLFAEIMDYVYTNLTDKKQTQVILVPSTNEISHTYPLPQPPMDAAQFQTTKMRKAQNLPTLVTNPAMITMNDISIGFVNTDVIKDMCVNMFVKNPANAPTKPKIDLALEQLLRQRSFYPLYPGSQVTPIEWEMYEKLMFPQSPDVLITPSDLVLFAKNIEGCVCINPGTVCKGGTGGSYAVITVDPIVLTDQEQQGLFSNRAAERIRVDVLNI